MHSQSQPQGVEGKLSRPLGLFERILMAREKAQDWGYVTNALLVDSETKLSPETLQKALTLLVKRYPALRMRVIEENGIQLFQEMEHPFRINYQIKDGTMLDGWLAAFNEEVNQPHPFNTQEGPLWRFLLLQDVFDPNQQRRVNVLIFSAHHVILDASSVVQLNNQLLEYVCGLDRGEDIRVESMPLTPSRDDLISHLPPPSLLQKLLFPVAVSLKGLKDAALKPRNIYLSIFPPVIARNPSVPKETCILPRSLSLEETKAVAISSKANKCTVHGAIVAATHLALARILLKGKPDLKTPITLDTVYTLGVRKECQPEVASDVFGAYVAFDVLPGTQVPPVINGKEDFWKFSQDSTRRVHDRVAAREYHKLINFSKCVGVERYVAMSSAERNAGRIDPAFSLTNVGRGEIGKGGPYIVTGAHLCVKEHLVGTLFTHTIMTINGRMSWTLTYHPHVTTKQQAEEMLDFSVEILKEFSC